MGKAFLLKSGGGGGGLNFRVLSGTSAPASPKTNDIWVNTSVEIPEWAFTASDPNTVDIYKTGTVVQGLYIKLDTGEEYAHELYSTLTANLPENTQSITVPAYNASTITVAHAFYDADGALISTVQRLPNTVTYDVPSGAVLVRVSFYQTDTKSVTANINPPEGAVWISIGTSSQVEFNALKKNGIQVYPISAKQYVSGAWVDVTAQSYQGGEWVEWIKWLFNNGDQCSDITGGWKAVNAAGGTGSVSTDSLVISYTGSADQHSQHYTVNKIDLSEITTLFAEFDITSSHSTSGILRFGISSNNTATKLPYDGGIVANMVATTGQTGNFTLELDVSSQTGSCYVFIYGCIVKGYCRKVWYE